MTSPLIDVQLKLRVAHENPKEIVRSLIPLLTLYENRIKALEEKVDEQRETIEALNRFVHDKLNRLEANGYISHKAVVVLTTNDFQDTNKASSQVALQPVQGEPVVEASLAEGLPVNLSPLAPSLPVDGSPSVPPEPIGEQTRAPTLVAENAKDIDKLRHLFKYEVDPLHGISYKELSNRFSHLKPTQLSSMCQKLKTKGAAHCIGRRDTSRWYPGKAKEAT